MKSVRVGIVLALVIGFSACNNEAVDQTADNPQAIPLGKLSLIASPSAYRIHLTIYPEKEAFTGETEIDVTLTESLNKLYLHGVDLAMQSIWIEDNGHGQSLNTTNFKQLTADGVASLSFPAEIGPGKVTLGFTYNASFATDLAEAIIAGN